MANLEVLLKNHNYKEALLHAQARLSQNIDDILARFVLGYAMYHLEGASKESFSILKEARESALNIAKQASSIIDTGAAAGPSLSTNPPALVVSATTEAENDTLLSGAMAEKPSGASGDLPTEFCTTSMAELLLKQGHSEMARDILLVVLQGDDANATAKQLLREIDSEGEAAMVDNADRRLPKQITTLNNFLTALEKRNYSR